jgi:hypothetical protein
MPVNAENKRLTLNRSSFIGHKSHYAIILICILIFNLRISLGQETSAYSELSSQTCSQKFFEMAREIAISEKVDETSARQAIVFVKAAIDLGGTPDNTIQAEIIGLISRFSLKDNFLLVFKMLENHLNQQSDYSVIKDAVSYLLNTTNTREQREDLINQILDALKGRNDYLDSEMLTSLGILRSELSDPNAISLFLKAYQANRYNKLAFVKLLDYIPQYVTLEARLEHLRLIFGENPFDLQAALSFAEFARQTEMYQLSEDAYQYSASLFAYLYPSRQLPPYIYLPWTMSAYNTQRSQYKCLDIAKNLELKGRFDLAAQTIAAKAAQKMGDNERADQIFEQTVKKAKQIYYSNKPADSDAAKIEVSQALAWFYCFAKPDANEAFGWAKRAYTLEPNKPTTASLVAYSLFMNKQTDKAKEIAEKFQTNQIANLTLAQIQLSSSPDSNSNNIGLQTLTTAIQKDAGSLEAEIAKQILTGLSLKYQPALNEETTMLKLKNTLKGPVMFPFISPARLFSVQLNLQGTKFDYGKNFGATLSIKNNSTNPMIISDESYFRGNIRIDAGIKGDINKKIAKLVSIKIQPTTPIGPGKSILVPIDLIGGELKKILYDHPQASLGIEFIVYLDPVILENKTVANRLTDVSPIVYRITRPPVRITTQYLKSRIDTITKEQSGLEIESVQLFAGLIKEQQEIAKGRVHYDLVAADWMPGTLTSAIIFCLKDKDWETKVQTMLAISNLTLNSKLLNVVADNLSQSQWPVRMTALYLLAKNKFNLDKVLDWSARYDQSRAVREMAIAFGAKVPQEQQQQLPKNLSDLIKKAAIDTNNIPASDSIKKAAVDSNNIPGSNPVNKSSQPADSNITPATLKPGL